MVSNEIVHVDLEEQKLFCLAPATTYCGSTIRMEVFWPFKDLSLNDELAIMVLDQGDLTMDGVNNFMKKRISCRDNSLLNGLWPKNIIDFENIGNTVQDLFNKKLHGKGSYTFEDDVQGFACNFGFNSRRKEGSEDDIGEGDEEGWV